MLIERQKRESVGNRVLGANVGLRGARMTVVYFTTLVSFCDISQDSGRLHLHATLHINASTV